MKRGLRDVPSAQFDARLKTFIPRVILSACVMGGVLLMVEHLTQDLYEQGSFYKLMALGTLLASGLISYALAAALSGALNLNDIKTYVIKRGRTS